MPSNPATGKIKISNKKIIARAKLTSGPAAEINPFFLAFTLPAIMTAPGAAKINPRKLIITAKASIWLSALNSAQHL